MSFLVFKLISLLVDKATEIMLFLLVPLSTCPLVSNIIFLPSFPSTKLFLLRSNTD